MVGYPQIRLRRTRRIAWSRALMSEHHLQASDLILPLFVMEGEVESKEAIPAMSGCYRHTIPSLLKIVSEAIELNICAVALFPVTDQSKKDAYGTEALSADNLICRAVSAIKQSYDDKIGVICDVALDPYTDHGHDGILNQQGEVDNDETVKCLCKQAVMQAHAGCDIIAPSDMMDGRVGAIREALDIQGFQHVMILSYAAKYASAFYGPFRSAIGSDKNLGKADKRSYQMDPANAKEALSEVELDIAEGADIIMVKPGMPYLDIIRTISEEYPVPVWAYQVSGEYSMLMSLANVDEVMLESLLAFKRAGARCILTYAALDVAKKIS